MKCLVLLLAFLLPASATVDIDAYIAKLYKPLNSSYKALELSDIDDAWLDDVEKRCSSLPSIEAEFLMLIDNQGHITNLELDDAKASPDELKDFIAKLAALEFAPRPESLRDLRLRFDAKYHVIARNEQLEQHEDALNEPYLVHSRLAAQNRHVGVDFATLRAQRSNPRGSAGVLSQNDAMGQLLRSSGLATTAKAAAILVSPEYYSNPRVGDRISFSHQGNIYNAQVLDLSSRSLLLVSDDLRDYWILDFKSASHRFDSALAAGASAGLGLGLATDGIANLGLAALAAMAAGTRELSLDRGEIFYLRHLTAQDFSRNNNKGATICKL